MLHLQMYVLNCMELNVEIYIYDMLDLGQTKNP